MNKAHLGTGLLILVSCAPAGSSTLNPSDDLHCAVITRTLEKNADQLGATPEVRRGLYVLQTWYFAKVTPERLEAAQSVVVAMKDNPSEVPSVGQVCSDRAFNHPGFARWQSIASADYDQKAAR